MASEDEKWDRLTAWMEEISEGRWQRQDLQVEFRQIPGAGRGLFAKQDIAPGSIILELPAATLLHPRTIKAADSDALARGTANPATIHQSVFPRSASGKRGRQEEKLTTTQTLSLYLALNRRSSAEKGHPRYSPWTAYLATLPTSFRPWHPLTWLIEPVAGAPESEHWSSLNHLCNAFLPESAYEKLQDMLERYKADVKMMESAVSYSIQNSSDDSLRNAWSQVTEEDLLWAWLNVNTRTLFFDLDMPPLPKPIYAEPGDNVKRARSVTDSEQQNHTMGPLLDLANHTHLRMDSVDPASGDARPVPLCSVRQVEESAGGSVNTKATKSGREGPLSWRKRTLQMRAPKASGLRKGDQIVFAYGAHSDQTLFSEYGFVPSDERNPWNEIRMDDYINAAWRKVEDPSIISLKSEVLAINGYLGDYTLHSAPSPSHPSYRLLVAMRLMYAQIPEKALKSYIDSPHDRASSPTLQAFLDLIMGINDSISEENEENMRAALHSICAAQLRKVDDSMTALAAHHYPTSAPNVADAKRMVERLWANDREILDGVIRNLDANVIF